MQEKTISSVALGRLELFILLSQSPDFCDYRHAPLHQTQMFLWDGRLEQSWDPGRPQQELAASAPLHAAAAGPSLSSSLLFSKSCTGSIITSPTDSCARKACTLSQFLHQGENIKMNGRQVQDRERASQSGTVRGGRKSHTESYKTEAMQHSN